MYGLSAPTDNIYKFYAIFGITVLIACILSLPQVHNQKLEKQIAALNEIDRIEREAHVDNKVQLREIQLKLFKIAREDARYISMFLMIIAFISLIPVVFGMYTWHTVFQPKQDELLALQTEKFRRDVGSG